MANGLIPDDSVGATPCANDTTLTTSQTCDVKCDTGTHVGASGTLTCVEAAVDGSTQLSGFTCTQLARCITLRGTSTDQGEQILYANEQCGPGYIYDTEKDTTVCDGATCVGASTDRETCCVAQATCGNTDGNDTPVSPDDCGDGYSVNAEALSTGLCVGTTCDVAGNLSLIHI